MQPILLSPKHSCRSLNKTSRKSKLKILVFRVSLVMSRYRNTRHPEGTQKVTLKNCADTNNAQKMPQGYMRWTQQGVRTAKYLAREPPEPSRVWSQRVYNFLSSCQAYPPPTLTQSLQSCLFLRLRFFFYLVSTAHVYVDNSLLKPRVKFTRILKSNLTLIQYPQEGTYALRCSMCVSMGCVVACVWVRMCRGCTLLSGNAAACFKFPN